jgi:hypothetical protein
MTDHDTTPDYDLDDDWEPEEESLPKRPRRRLVTPVSATLAGALVAALGFIGGVEVQKGQGDGGTGNGGNAALASAGGAGVGGAGRGGFSRGAGAGGGGGAAGQFDGGGPGGAAANATVGSVANKKGSTLYVKDSDGNLIRVKTTSHSKINRTASTSPGAIHPGDTVIVQGTTAKDGTVTATQVNATASGARSGLAGLFGAFGGAGGAGAGPQQAAPPAGG